MTQKKKRVGKYELGGLLGEGTFGKVKYAEHAETGENVAIKVLDKAKIQRQNMGVQIKREVGVMKLVDNPHVVRLREVLASKTKIYIVLELVTGGELFDEIVRERKFSEGKARFYFRQLVDGVKHCHERGVCHRDLKPENLLLDEEKNLKISDFGLSALYTGPDDDEGGGVTSSRAALLHTTCGTPNYVAPEVLEDKGYDGRGADVWSVGVILYVLVSGRLPFDEPTMQALFEKIQSATFDVPPFLSRDVRDLIGRILVADPRDRASLDDIRAHPWFRARDDETGPDLRGDRSNSFETCLRQAPGRSDKSETKMQGNGSWRNASVSDLQDKRDLRFVSKAPISDIVDGVGRALKEMLCEVHTSDDAHKIKVCRMTPRGMIGASIQIKQSSQKDDSVVEIRRGKGDILFKSLERQLSSGSFVVDFIHVVIFLLMET